MDKDSQRQERETSATSPLLYAGYVGMDVHKNSIAVAVAWDGREKPKFFDTIENTPQAVASMVGRLNDIASPLLFCYEASPCGFALYKTLTAMDAVCQVVVPPRHMRIKTDPRDALRLAGMLRAGELTSVWIPDQEQEAIRDLCRCRADFRAQGQNVRQQLNAFVLRHGHHWPSRKKRWTRKHFEWLEAIRFAFEAQNQVRDEYVAAVRLSDSRVLAVDRKLRDLVAQWSWAPAVYGLMALRGFDHLSSITLLSELGDISRFESPTRLMGYLGLVPSVYSSGEKRRTGGVTQAGNQHARRVLVESAWSYRFPARQTAYLTEKAEEVQASAHAQAVAWKAQQRLCERYQKLLQSGKSQKVVCVAVARELTGFVWDIVCHEMSRCNRVEEQTSPC